MLYAHDVRDTNPYAPGMELVVCNFTRGGVTCGQGRFGHDRVSGECKKFVIRDKRHAQLPSLR